MSFENICILLFTLSLIFTLKFSHQTTKAFLVNKTNLKPKIQEDLHEIHFSGSWHISDKWRRVNVSLWDLQAAIHQTLQSTIDDNHCRVNVAQLTIHHYISANKLWNTRSWDMCLSYIGAIHFRLSKKVGILSQPGGRRVFRNANFFKSPYVTPLSYVTCVRQDRHLWMGSFHTLPLVKSRLIDGSQEVGLARGISRVTIIIMSSSHSIIIIIIMNICNLDRAKQVNLNNSAAL